MTGCRGPRNRVLGLLALAGLAAAFGLAFLSQAPNRLVSGTGIPLHDVLHGTRLVVLVPAAVLLAGAWFPAGWRQHAVVAGAASLWLTGLVWVAGDHARQVAATASGFGRTSFGGGFWVLVALAGLAAADAVHRLGLGAVGRTAVLAAVWAPVVALGASGALDALSLFKEYANHRDVFGDALWRHAEIVGATLVPTLLAGVPLGVAAFRRPALAAPLLAVLNVVQTVPSIALFALLMAPLAALAGAAPWLGIGGVGLAPAVIALTFYSLLPIVQATLAGLQEVPPAAVQAAVGMGFTRSQVFWRVEAPLALPLLLSGLRLTAVQAIGLAVVAALIGAGGLGAIVFQGLLGSALDLVLLGVLPVVVMAAAADAVFGGAARLVARGHR